MKVITIKEKTTTLSGVFGEYDTSRSGKNISVFCPNCARSPKTKKKKKLSICLETGIYHCWICEIKGKNIAYLVKKEKGDIEALSKLYQYFGTSSSLNTEDIKTIALPEDFKLLCLSSGINAKTATYYLRNRGLTIDDIIKYKVGISNQFEFNNRVIFPSFDSSLNLNFYLSRTYDENVFRKYKNCDTIKKDIIFNENMIDWSRQIVLVEGVFDAIKAGDNAVCMLGSWIDESYKLFKTIVKHKTPVILALDPDAIEKAQKISKKLSEYCIDVKIATHTGKDFGDMTKKEAKFYIHNSKRFDVADRMRYLIGEIKSGSMY
jgi:DNA primase